MGKFIEGIALTGVVIVGGGLILAFVGACFFGVTLLEAWLADFLYSVIFETPTSDAPQITYPMWVGIAFLFNLVFGGKSGVSVVHDHATSRRA